jgi:hypothetical protein
MTDDTKSILDAMAANHLQVMTRINGVVEPVDALALSTKVGFDRVAADFQHLQSGVARIETKLGRHESRIEALEKRP